MTAPLAGADPGAGAPDVAEATSAGPATSLIAQAATETGGTPTLDGSALTTTHERSVAPAAVTVDRLAGSTRYATAVRISQRRFTSTAQTVYLARGDVLADALAGGILTDGPVLLVPACGTLPAVVRNEITRLGPTSVHALGGEDSVCPSMLTQAAQGLPTGRLAGSDRYGTAAAISRRVFGGGASVAYLAKGADSPDAVAGGTLRDGPVLLASQDGSIAPAATREEIGRLGVSRVVALGSSGAVSDAALSQAAQGRATSRVAGADRYATAAAVARRVFPNGSKQVYLARGDGLSFVDAVAAGILTDGPVLLVKGPCATLPTPVRSWLAGARPTRITLIGGSDVVCDDIGEQARKAATPPPPPGCDTLRCVALTFDDGPGQATGQLLDTLDRTDVPATFFVVGQNAVARPAMVRRAAAEGHEVANHTWDHKQMTTLTQPQQLWEYDYTADRLQGIGLARTTKLRPPYGAWNSSTRTLGVPLILWSVDPEDWRYKDAAVVRRNVVSATVPGDIILLHDIHPTTVDAVPGIISDLRAKGYTFVSLNRLVAGMEPGDVVYRRGLVNEYQTLAGERSAAAGELPQVRDEFEPGALIAPPPGGAETMPAR